MAITQVIWVSDWTHLTNVSGYHIVPPLNLTVGNSWNFWRTSTLILCTLFIFVQSATSSGSTLSAIVVLLWQPDELHQRHLGLVETYCTGYSNPCKLEMTRSNWTIYVYWY